MLRWQGTPISASSSQLPPPQAQLPPVKPIDSKINATAAAPQQQQGHEEVRLLPDVVSDGLCMPVVVKE